MNEQSKLAVEAISAITVVATLMTWLPPIAAFLSIVWYLIRIFEWWRNKAPKE